MCEILKNFTFYLCTPSQEMTGGWYAKNETTNQETRRHVILETGYSTEVRVKRILLEAHSEKSG